MVVTVQSCFPVSEPTGLTLVNSEHYAEAPRFSAGVSHMLGSSASLNYKVAYAKGLDCRYV